MDVQVILTICGQAAMGLLLGMNTFWTKKFVKTVETLVTSVNNLEKDSASKNASCSEKHKSIDARLQGHHNEIYANREEINDLKTRVTVIEKKQCCNVKNT